MVFGLLQPFVIELCLHRRRAGKLYGPDKDLLLQAVFVITDEKRQLMADQSRFLGIVTVLS